MTAGAAGTTPVLARALAALAAAGGASADFSAAVVRMNEADQAYGAAIERILPPDKARELLAAAAAFRAAVSDEREETRAATGYGDFDPLDTYVPALPVSHAASVRIAGAADAARARVARLRAEVNARIGGLLERDEIERLTQAKRLRNAAFDRAIRDAVPAGTSDRLATQLLLLADGWY